MNVTLLVIFFFEQRFHKFFHFKWTLSYTLQILLGLPWFFCFSVAHLHLFYLICEYDYSCHFFLRTKFSQIVYFHLRIQSHIVLLFSSFIVPFPIHRANLIITTISFFKISGVCSCWKLFQKSSQKQKWK